jgi:hypothetical protein
MIDVIEKMAAGTGGMIWTWSYNYLKMKRKFRRTGLGDVSFAPAGNVWQWVSRPTNDHLQVGLDPGRVGFQARPVRRIAGRPAEVLVMLCNPNLKGAFFSYSDEAWKQIVATLPEGVDPSIRGQLEGEAYLYCWFTAKSEKSPETRAIKTSAARILRAAERFLFALDTSSIDPVHLGFGCRERRENDSWIVGFDSELATVELEELRRQISLIVNKS